MKKFGRWKLERKEDGKHKILEITNLDLGNKIILNELSNGWFDIVTHRGEKFVIYSNGTKVKEEG